MNQTIINQIRNDSAWVRINYKTESTHGFMIMKPSMYETARQTRKWKRLLGGNTLIKIILNYPLTMMDFCISTLREYKKKLQHYHNCLERECTRFYINDDYVMEYKKKIEFYAERVNRLERKVSEIYYE